MSKVLTDWVRRALHERGPSTAAELGWEFWIGRAGRDLSEEQCHRRVATCLSALARRNTLLFYLGLDGRRSFFPRPPKPSPHPLEPVNCRCVVAIHSQMAED